MNAAQGAGLWDVGQGQVSLQHAQVLRLFPEHKMSGGGVGCGKGVAGRHICCRREVLVSIGCTGGEGG